jgi:PRD1 phage membrane DNA delivery
MGDSLVTSIVTVLTAVIGLAIIAVLVSRNAQTGAVLGQAGSAFANILGAAESPVTSGGGIGSSLINGFTGGGVSISPY